MKNNPPNPPQPGKRATRESSPKDQVAPEPTGDAGTPGDGPTGLPESAESPTTFPELTKRPGQVGLANEARPGLGTRNSDEDAAAARAAEPIDSSGKDSKPRVTTRTYEEPRPEPREQSPDSFAHEEERSSGVSGHSGNS